jgi:hypothetical protein
MHHILSVKFKQHRMVLLQGFPRINVRHVPTFLIELVSRDVIIISQWPSFAFSLSKMASVFTLYLPISKVEAKSEHILKLVSDVHY